MRSPSSVIDAGFNAMWPAMPSRQDWQECAAVHQPAGTLALGPFPTPAEREGTIPAR
jgi:hypothetical protein